MRRARSTGSATVSALALLACASCSRAPDVALAIRVPADRRLLAGVTRLDLRAERDGDVLAQQSFDVTAGQADYVWLGGVRRGPRTVFTLEGVDAAGDVVGRGATCPIDFEGPGAPVSLYFAPTSAFLPTAGPPVAVRSDPVALALPDGTVLLASGADPTGRPIASSEIYAPPSGTFAPAAGAGLGLSRPRWRAEVAEVPSVGALVVGGVDDATGQPVAAADVYDAAMDQFLPLDNQRLGARVGHRAVTLPDGRVLIAGGAGATGAPLASSVFVYLQPDGTASVSPGPDLAQARREHAAVVAVGGLPVMIGGYGVDGAPLASLEVLIGSGTATFVSAGALQQPRAEATATLLDDDTILVVGGMGADGTPRADAELYNPYSHTTTVLPLGTARRRHSATPIVGGRVLIAGGLGADGKPLASAELYLPGIGFVSERPLGTPRAGHVAVALCDGTVLVAGGGPGAELYEPPPR